METFTGQQIVVRIRATDPVTQRIITDASAIADFFAPGKDPVHSPADRASPDFTYPAYFDSASRYYLVPVTTDGWTPGIWTVRGTISGGAGGYFTWAYFPFTLDP